MYYILGLITGSCLTAAACVYFDFKSAKRVHEEFLREWHRANEGYSIVRSVRHRRSDRHVQSALPTEQYEQQFAIYGKARAKRIDGRWIV